MHRLTVTLKQHTPLIHFQHDQEGATLRASEVKPKLDRFILNQLGMNKLVYDKSLKIAVKKNPTITSISNYEAGQICLNKLKWLKGESASLDYKLKISPMSNYQRYLLAAFLSKKKKEILDREQKKYISPCPCFGDEEIFGLLSNDCISLTFSSFESELLDCIKENIISFFVYNNFGFRQSKGFGCFSVIKP